MGQLHRFCRVGWFLARRLRARHHSSTCSWRFSSGERLDTNWSHLDARRSNFGDRSDNLLCSALCHDRGRHFSIHSFARTACISKWCWGSQLALYCVVAASLSLFLHLCWSSPRRHYRYRCQKTHKFGPQNCIWLFNIWVNFCCCTLGLYFIFCRILWTLLYSDWCIQLNFTQHLVSSCFSKLFYQSHLFQSQGLCLALA